MRPNCVTGTFPLNCSAGVALRSSNPYTAHGAHHISQSKSATLPPPPRSSLLSPSEPASRSWHHPPCPSGSPADHAPLTNHGNCRPTAPVHRSAICAPFVGNVSCAFVAGSTALLSTSNVAKCRDPPPCRLLRPSVRPLRSAQIAPPPNQNIFS